MDNLTWTDIYNSGRNFLYTYPELSIWIGIALLLLIFFYLLVYSFEARRMFAIMILISLIGGYALYHFGYIALDFVKAPAE